MFLCNSVIGVAAVLQRQRERERSMPGVVRWWRLSVAAVKAFTRYRPRRLGVQLGGRTSRLRTRALVVAVNAYDRAALPRLARARLDSGELVLYVVDAVGPLRLLGRILDWIAGRAPGIGIERHRGARLAVSSRHKRLRVMNDGELRLVSSPLRYRLHRKALRVLVPALAAEPPTVDAGKDAACVARRGADILTRIVHISDLHFGRTDPQVVEGLVADINRRPPKYCRGQRRSDAERPPCGVSGGARLPRSACRAVSRGARQPRYIALPDHRQRLSLPVPALATVSSPTIEPEWR